MGAAAAGLFALGCGAPGARSPEASSAALPAAFARAFSVDATGDPMAAVEAHLDVVHKASQAEGDPWQLSALQASLDALATRVMPSLGEAARDASLVSRTQPDGVVATRLLRDEANAKGRFARGLIARTLMAIAQRRGDVDDSRRQREASGCVSEALVLGPTTWTAITGVRERLPLMDVRAPIQVAYPSDGAFGQPMHPLAVRAKGCAIDLAVESTRPGVRQVVVDVVVPRDETIGIVLRSHGAASLLAGGTKVLDRPFGLGDGEAARFASVAATSGMLRIVVSVGTAKEDDTLEIDVFDANGAPLRGALPPMGSTSAGSVRNVEESRAPLPRGNDEIVLAAASAIAGGDPREAERVAWAAAVRADARPDVALVYGRAIETAIDLSSTTRAERARSAYERVLEAWPSSWEATIAHAVLAGVRRGRDEAGLESLRALDAVHSKHQGPAQPVVDVFDGMVSAREGLFDRARAALSRARPTLGSTAFFADAEATASPRVGSERVDWACNPSRALARDGLTCFEVLRAAGDRPGAKRELARLRDVLGAPAAFLALELREALAGGDDETARRAFGAMAPGKRTLTALTLLDGWSHDARAKLFALAPGAPDAPASIAPLLRAVGDDDTGDFDATAERLSREDRGAPVLPNAATAVLSHTESYDVAPSGLVHWLLFDVRRVSGTTDVEENAQAAPPDVWGRVAMRALRRRILKRDGRILEPDRAPHASQAHADLSQLEQGDVVEAVYEGYSLPGDTGDLGIDTPDLLPDRTAVHDATIALRLPATVHGALFSHALLGKAIERVDGDRRTLTWHMTDRPARRGEDGVPKMDRNVGVSFSTTAWGTVARALRETIAALDDHDPEIAVWARDVARERHGARERDAAVAPAASAKSSRAIIDAIVAAAGRSIREATADTLSDFGGGIAPVQEQTARTFLASHQGSRTWLIARSLRELGIPSDLVVAENDPYSADPAFPPHFGRFAHPLLVAHIPPVTTSRGGIEKADDVWIDADVPGPPLPAGRISPELRGRFALHADGAIVPLPTLEQTDQERDEADVRLLVDGTGNARGTFAIVLRGRDAQQLAEALLRTVGADRQRALREVVLAWLPWANVDDVELASTEGSWQVSLRADVTVSGYAQAEGEKTWLLPGLDALHQAWPHGRVQSLASAFAARAGRESALAIGAAVQYHLHRRIELPVGAAVARLPGPIDVKGKLVDASRRITVEGAVIEDEFVLGVATGTVQAVDYDAFAVAAHQADDGFLASTRVTAPPPPPAVPVPNARPPAGKP